MLFRSAAVSFVCDTENARVVAFADGAPSGTIIAGGFGPGNGVGQLNKPWDIVVLGADVLISDRNNHRIVQVAQDGSGRYTASVVHGAETSQLSYPTGMAIESGDLLVSDCYNHRVMRVTLPAGGNESSAVVIAGGNGMGIGYEQLKYPEGLAVHGGAVYVTDRGNSRVMKWAFGATTGAVAAGFNGNGPALHQLSNPYGIDVADGVIYVADSSNHRVVAWVDGATTGAIVTGFNSYGTGEYQLYHPMGVTAQEGTVYVTDRDNHRLFTLALSGAAGASPADARIVFGGRGPIARSNAMGWLDRFFNGAWFPN